MSGVPSSEFQVPGSPVTTAEEAAWEVVEGVLSFEVRREGSPGRVGSASDHNLARGWLYATGLMDAAKRARELRELAR